MSVAELIPEYLQAVAIVLAGLWAYWRFFYQQNHEPATDIGIKVERIGLQAGCQILEVTATLENKSLVKHKYEDFRMNMRYLLADDPVRDGGSEHNYQLYFPHSIDERIKKSVTSPTLRISIPANNFIIDMRRLCRSMQRPSGCTVSSLSKTGRFQRVARNSWR